MKEKLSTMWQSRRFWLAVGAVLEAALNHFGVPVNITQILGG